MAVDITVPETAQATGVHSLGWTANDPRAAMTTFVRNPDGSLGQTTEMITGGTLAILSSDPGQIVASIQIQSSAAALSGSFTATRCP